jgi:hypothetical protein
VRLAAEERFAKRRPERAIELYAKAAAQVDASSWLGVRSEILAGDTYQFDLAAPDKARQHYEAALARLAGVPEQAAGDWWKRWLTHEVAFLRTGAVFKGPLSRDEALAALGAGALLAGSQYPFSEPKDAVQLKSEPRSRLSLARSVSALSLMPAADDILRFLEARDPGGYWSACILAAVPYLGRMQQDGLRAASERFLRERGVTVRIAEVDPRKSSPEGTWRLFMESLMQADLASAYGCLTPAMKARFEPMLSRLPGDKLREMAESFSGFAMTSSFEPFREAIVRRGERAGFVYFQRVEGEWKISEM